MSEFSIFSLRRQVAWAKDNVFEAGETHFSPFVPVFALWLMLEGEAKIETHDQIWPIQTGEIWLGAPCRARRISTQSGAHWLSLGLGEIGVLQGLAPRVLQADKAERARLETLLRLLIEDENGALVGGLATAIVALVSRIAGETKRPIWAGAVLEKIHSEPNCRVGELARLAHFSPAQFRRVFAHHFGLAPRDFLTRHRLERARDQLETSENSVAQVARDCGFGGAPQFSREFKRFFGLTPRQCRIVARENVM